MKYEHEFGGQALSLYNWYIERGLPVSLQMWSTQDGGQHCKISWPPIQHFRPPTQLISQHKPVNHKTPCRRRRDLKRMEPWGGLNEVETKFMELGAKFKELETKFKELETKFMELKTKFKELETKFKDLEPKFKKLHNWDNELDTQLKKSDKRLEVLGSYRKLLDTRYKEPDHQRKESEHRRQPLAPTPSPNSTELSPSLELNSKEKHLTLTLKVIADLYNLKIPVVSVVCICLTYNDFMESLSCPMASSKRYARDVDLLLQASILAFHI